MSGSDFRPAFEFINWNYESFLVNPTGGQGGIDLAGKSWVKGKMTLSDGIGDFASGFLSNDRVKARMSAEYEPGKDGGPAPFKAVCKFEEDSEKGAEYHLSGWAIPGSDGKVTNVRGTVIAIRGSDAKPDADLAGLPLGTAGPFLITKA